MSTEENSHTDNLTGVSPGATQDMKHKHGHQTGLFINDGDNNVTDFPISSASKLLKTIVIASQAANQQQQESVKTSNQSMEKPLPQDLQNFKGVPFTLQYSNVSQNSEQSNSPFENNPQTKFNGVTSEIFRALVTVKQDTDMVNDALHVNTDQNENISHNSNAQSFEGLNMQQSPEFGMSKNGMLHRILSGDNIVEQNFQSSGGNYSVSSPTDFNKCSPASSANSPYGDSNLSPFGETNHSMCMDTDTQPTGFKDLMKSVTTSDTTTQSSLITHTGMLRLDSLNVESNLENDAKFDLVCDWNATKAEDSPDRFKNGKVPRMHQDSDVSSALSPSVDTVFHVEGAQQEVPSDFTFHLFGQGEAEQNSLNVFPIASENNESPSSIDSHQVPAVVEQFKTPQSLPHNVTKQQRDRLRRAKEPILSQAFPAKLHGYEIRILQQPEEQHRARYLTEGSRGSVKNRSGSGFPVVKLLGHTGEATLQVFIGNDSGRVRPHGFYQACKVCGKNSTMCAEKDIDGTTVIEIELQSANDMTASIDCVGILKLRNADVEQRIGIAKAKKKSTKARMIFRVTFQKPCGSPQVLQVASSTILCTQPIGQPEICKMSLRESSMAGGEELYIIGKNFLRGTRVFFQEVKDEETGQTLWEKEGEIDKDYFQTTHMIVVVPEYCGQTCGGMKVGCQVVVNSGGKMSDPQPFCYKQVDPSITLIKQDTMDTTEESRKRNYPFVAPEALELNQQIQQSQQVSNNSDMFQLPPGIISGMPDSNHFNEMDRNNMSDTGTPNPSSTQPVPNEGFTTDELEEEATTMKQTPFGQENLEMAHTQTWDSKQDKDVFEVNDKNLEVNNQMEFTSMNTDEFEEEESLNPSFMRMKSPRLSKDGYESDHIGLISSPSENNIVSQFLQNMSMLKQSDPMFCMNSTAPLTQKSLQTNTILTTVNSHVLMTADTHNNPTSATSSGIQKQSSTEHSFLKEALTCPQVSLEHPNFRNLQSGQQTQTQFIPKTEAGVTAMDIQVDNALMNSRNLQLDLQLNVKSSETMDVLSQPTSVNHIAEMSSPAPGHQFSSSTPTFSPEQTTQVQPSSPFSPSHVLTSFRLDQSSVTELKPSVSNVGTFLQNNEMQAVQQSSLLSQGFLPESKSNHDTIITPSFLDKRLASPTVLTPTLPQVIPINSIHQTSTTPSQTNINAVLQKLLTPSLLSNQQQQQQFIHQLQTPAVSASVQQTQFQQHPEIQNVTKQQPQQTHQIFLHHQQQQQQQQQPSKPVLIQPQIHHLVTQQQQHVEVTGALPSVVAPATVGVQSTIASPTPNQNPVAPQIIICNNTGSQGQLPQTQFNSPSIVIVPGQSGGNNQVENLLRSILGSMMQPQQQQQQPPQ